MWMLRGPEMSDQEWKEATHASLDQETLYLSVGLLNTSYREEYSFWINSKDTVIATWRPNVTYLPEQPDMVWKFTGNFKS